MDNKPCDKCEDTAQILITSTGDEKKKEDSLCIACASEYLLTPGIQLRSDGALLLSDKSGNTSIISSDNPNYARLMVFYNIYTNSKAPGEKVIAARHQTMWRLDLEWDVYLQKPKTDHSLETLKGKEGKEQQQQGGGAKQARKKKKKKKKKQEEKSSRVLLIINIIRGEKEVCAVKYR